MSDDLVPTTPVKKTPISSHSTPVTGVPPFVPQQSPTGPVFVAPHKQPQRNRKSSPSSSSPRPFSPSPNLPPKCNILDREAASFCGESPNTFRRRDRTFRSGAVRQTLFSSPEFNPDISTRDKGHTPEPEDRTAQHISAQEDADIIRSIQDEERRAQEADQRIKLQTLRQEELLLRHCIPPFHNRDFEDLPPDRQACLYAYTTFYTHRAKSFLRALAPWADFIRKHPDVFEDPTLPIVDVHNNPVDSVSVRPDALALIPVNKAYLQAQSTPPTPVTTVPQVVPPTTTQSGPSTIPSDDTNPRPSTSGATTSVTTPISATTQATTSTTPSSTAQGSLPHPTPTPSTSSGGGGGKPPPRPPTPPSPSSPHSSRDSSPEMSLRDKATFFPSSTFDGSERASAKAHWQAFSDFVNRQGFHSTNDIKDITDYFSMTLRGLAREWLTSQKDNYESLEDLEKLFLAEYNQFGKTPSEWLHAFLQLKYEPDTDDFDRFYYNFTELSTLLSFGKEHALNSFKVAMPKEIRLQIRDAATLPAAATMARELALILYPSAGSKITTQMAAMSIQPPEKVTFQRSRSPSLSPTRQNTINNGRTSRSRNRGRPQRPTFSGFRQYPGRDVFPSRSSSRRRPVFKFRSRSRSLGRGRPQYPLYPPRQPIVQCFRCGRFNHTAYNCRSYRQSFRRGRYRGQANYRPRGGRPQQQFRQNHRQVRFNDNTQDYYNYAPPDSDQDLNSQGNPSAPM